jgi:hypothetical protein
MPEKEISIIFALFRKSKSQDYPNYPFISAFKLDKSISAPLFCGRFQH